MEKYIDIITLINQYLNNELSASEKADFTNRLENDSEFNTAYEEQLIFLGGLERVQLKNEITKARSSYIKTKWIKGILISAVVIAMGIIAYQFTQNEDAATPKQPEVEMVIGVVEDSLIVSEEKQEIAIENVDSIRIINEIIPTEKSTLEEQAESEVDSLILDEGPLKIEGEVVEKASFNPIRKVPESFVLNNEKDITITCKEGTKLTFQKHAFVNAKTKKLVRGTIDLKVEEYYKLDDILLADLSTTSNGKMLETGGMLYIKAEKNGQELMLDPNKLMRIEFPSKEKKDGMQLFLGEENEDGINWVLSENSEIDQPKEREIVDVPFAVIEQVPVFPGCEDVEKEQQRECFKSKMQQFIRENLNTKLAEALGITKNQVVYVNFVIDTTGSVNRLRSRADHPVLQQEAERVIKMLPKMLPGRQRGYTVGVPYSIPIQFPLKKNLQVIFGKDKAFRKKQDSITIAKFHESIEKGDASNLSTPEINAYVFSNVKFGWINCDRFGRARRNGRFILKIKEADGSKIKLIFKNRRSILPGKVQSNAVDFGSVPMDEKVLLFAMKRIDGKYFMATDELKTANGLVLDLDYKEMSLKEIREAIEKATAAE